MMMWAIDGKLEGRQNICKLTEMLFLLFSLVFVRPCMTPVNWCEHIIFLDFALGVLEKSDWTELL